MVQYSKLDTDPLLIVICWMMWSKYHIFLDRLNNAKQYPHIYGLEDLDYYFNTADMKCIQKNTEKLYPIFAQNFEGWQEQLLRKGPGGPLLDAWKFFADDGLHRMDPREIESLSKQETSEETLDETFWAIVAAAQKEKEEGKASRESRRRQ